MSRFLRTLQTDRLMMSRTCNIGSTECAGSLPGERLPVQSSPDRKSTSSDDLGQGRLGVTVGDHGCIVGRDVEIACLATSNQAPLLTPFVRLPSNAGLLQSIARWATASRRSVTGCGTRMF